MSDTLPPMPPSPGVGMRRKGSKQLPRLPLSAFSSPNSGTSDRFPLPPSPNKVHPEYVVDAHVAAGGADLTQWKAEAGQVLGGRIGGVVLSPQGKDIASLESLIAEIESNPQSEVISVIVPFKLEEPPLAKLPSSKLPLALSTIYTKSTPDAVTTLKWAIANGKVVDIDIQSDIMQTDEHWETFEDFLTKGTADLPKATPIVLCNILPPPANLELPIVQLLKHPEYRAYQARTAALSLFPNIYVKFLPPNWHAPTPPTAPPSETLTVGSQSTEESPETKEWKRRIKMYLGPVLEAFGYSRIIFGSSPSGSSHSKSDAGYWYEIARESLAELAVEQEAIDSVFSANARKVYGHSA